MRFNVYRNCDTWRLRKVVVEVYDKNGELIDRTRMCAGPWFAQRLMRRKRMMAARAVVLMG